MRLAEHIEWRHAGNAPGPGLQPSRVADAAQSPRHGLVTEHELAGMIEEGVARRLRVEHITERLQLDPERGKAIVAQEEQVRRRRAEEAVALACRQRRKSRSGRADEA